VYNGVDLTGLLSHRDRRLSSCTRLQNYIAQ